MRTFLFIASLLSLFAVGFFFFGSYATNHFTGSLKGEQRFEVKTNENILTLGTRLELSGLVFSRYTFVWYMFHEEKSRRIIAGEYLLSGTLTIPELAVLLTTGKTVSHDIKVTFPEGWTFAKMAERLTAKNLPGEEFLALAEHPIDQWRTTFTFLSSLPKGASLEGYLFPDTYLFAPDATAEEIVTSMLQNFEKKWGSLLGTANNNNASLDPKRLHAMVTMASIIEEEGRSKEERDMISDIFWKRITVGQALQSDATINYIHGTTRLQPTLKDTEADSLYNTYKNTGLPPGPISNPGLVSLQAAVYPKGNPYFYFLVDAKNGETIYSVTFEEHVRNRTLHGL